MRGGGPSRRWWRTGSWTAPLRFVGRSCCRGAGACSQTRSCALSLRTGRIGTLRGRVPGGSIMVTERGLQVLRAIVQDYVDTHEPVGSKAIVERHAFDVSAATIRNDMAMLEDEDLITAPHTSSGRVPTDKGYRVFVDHLAEIRPLTPAQRAAIATFLSDPQDLDDLLARTVRLLTQLTGQVALVQYPSFARANVTHLELVALEPSRLL